MYTVMKIGKENKDGTKSDSPDTIYTRVTGAVDPLSPSENPRQRQPSDEEGYRHSITLDMGVNALYIANSKIDKTGASTFENTIVTEGDDVTAVFPAHPDTSATIYKFYPPTLASTGTTGYNYVAECSNRGLCDSETGICECFAGYTGNACEVVNSLAV